MAIKVCLLRFIKDDTISEKYGDAYISRHKLDRLLGM